AEIGLTDDVCTLVTVSGTNILAAGTAAFGDDTNLGIIKYTSGGSVDTSFGISGFIVTHLIETRNDENCYGVTVNGDIMLSGYAKNSTNNSLVLWELFSGGEPMTNFSSDGKEIPLFTHPSKAFAVTTDSLDPGNVVVVGESNGDFAVARYNYINPTDPDDESFSGDGLTTTDFGSSNESAKAVLTLSSGKILVAGNSNGDVAIAKYNSDGTLDTSFDTDGKITFDISLASQTEEVNGMALQSDGKILIAGSVFNGTNNDIFVARFTSSGTFDGSTTIPVGTGDDVAKGIAVQSSGKIVLGGYTVNNAANKDIVLVRLNDIGDIDETFGTNGFVETTLGNNGEDICNALSLDASGKIIIAGSTDAGSPSTKDFAVVRYTADGSVDGTAIVSIGRSDEEANALFIQSDGKIVAAGYSFNGSKNDVAAIRLEDVTPLPVELMNFSAVAAQQNIELQWQTATETNNYGFEIERRAVDDRHLQGDGHLAWMKTGFVEGNGTTNAPKEYSFVDHNLSSGSWSYRLKQIDRDGKFEYSQSVEVTIASMPKVFALEQNYPNPFNPTTTINYQLPVNGKVTLKVYDAIGREVASLVNEVKEAGYYSATFDASKLSSGMYFAQLQSGDNMQLMKMLLLK
ncbi:MAG: T9SS type A sorting domain-containing protein, partial [Bacteroidetes bacterium]|nr:T9SS type A sorting domain-containing protein [Bacteroidota bacterium]